MPTLPGPWGPVFYERDEWGYPSIKARHMAEGHWARGYFHALDRLGQVHLTLTVGEGRLMEFLGDQPFARLLDRSVRMLGLSRHIKQDVAALSPEARSFIDPYCDGFNAGAAAAGRPWLMRLLGIPTRLYTPAQVILLYRTVCWFGLASLVQAGKMFLGQMLSDGASSELIEALYGAPPHPDELERARGVPWHPLDRLITPPVRAGSNAFAVSASRSRTGGALLMGEFHMEIGRQPPVVYAVHIDLPEEDYFQGITIPGLPLINCGRNPRLGWTYTYGHANQIDLRVERCRGGARIVDGRAEPLWHRVERVRMRGKGSEAWDFWDYPGGTVLGNAHAEGDLPAVSWRGLFESAQDFNAFVQLYSKRTVREVLELHRQVKTVSVAGVFTDTEGSIGWVHTGRVAAARDGVGLGGPFTSAEVKDVPEEQRPMKLNPAEGFIASANEESKGWTFVPEPRYRFARISELLSGEGAVSPEDLLAISYDHTDLCARRLMSVWEEHLPAAAEPLARWAKDQSTPNPDLLGLFHALHHEACLALLSRWLPPQNLRELMEDGLGATLFHERLDDVLALEKPHLLDAKGLAGVLAAAWPAAQKRVAEGFHVPVRTKFKNVLEQGVLPSFLGVSTPLREHPGGPTSPFQSTSLRLFGQEVVFGPAFHYLTDMSQPKGRYNIAGGASERWRGPGYGAGLDEWFSGELRPLG